MKVFKKIFLLIAIIILSGCSVKYNLSINEDKSISEKVIANEKTEKLESLTKLKEDQAVKYLFNMFKRKNENINLITNKDNGITYSIATTSHDDIDSYVNKFKSDVVEKANIERNNGIVTLTMNQSKKLGFSESNSLMYDDIEVNIKVPFKVTYSNADKVSLDTYTWKINKDEDLKTIKISYDEGSLRNSLNIKLNEKTYNINYVIIAISVIIVLLLILLLVIYKNNKKNNVI